MSIMGRSCHAKNLYHGTPLVHHNASLRKYVFVVVAVIVSIKSEQLKESHL